jgi:transposase
MNRDEAEGGRGLSVRDAAKQLGVSASGIYAALRQAEEREADANDLEG